MELRLKFIIIRYFIFCTSLCIVCSLKIQDYTTRKPRITKYMTTTKDPLDVEPPTKVTTEEPVTVKNQPYYRVKTESDNTCILMTTDALIEISFKSNIGDEKIDTFVPDKPFVQGNCKYEDTQIMTITWPGYVMEWNFAKTPGGDRWYVDKISLEASTEQKHYHNIAMHGSKFKLTHSQMLFPTPVGRSYECAESIVTLKSTPGEGGPQNVTGTLFLREFQLQPFMFKGEQFEQSFTCSNQRSYRDETAPIAVGSTLAIAVLGIITGYGAFRYFKVKKVQYNTME